MYMYRKQYFSPIGLEIKFQGEMTFRFLLTVVVKTSYFIMLLTPEAKLCGLLSKTDGDYPLQRQARNVCGHGHDIV